MKNVTLSMPEDLLEKSRAYARARGTTLNQMMRDMLQRELDREGRSKFLELIAKAKEQGQASDGPYLTREEANER
ncbi:MAG TPA: ribbon-helix-helix protein, CopG family [Fimbriimonas sp.]|nr:ribbon-helix-helix protein, CopG family [Fimbriimonas sp.]